MVILSETEKENLSPQSQFKLFVDRDTSPVKSRNSFPASPNEGDICYRTDLDTSFTYDYPRRKWLGELEWDGAGRNGAQSDGYLRRFNGMAMTTTLGIYLPYTITITGITMCWDTSATGDIEIRRNGVVIRSVSFNGTTLSDMTLNDDIIGGSVLSFYVNNLSTSITSPQVKCYFRRKG